MAASISVHGTRSGAHRASAHREGRCRLLRSLLVAAFIAAGSANVAADPASAIADAVALAESTFETEKLASLSLGIWHEGEPLVVMSLGYTTPGVPATPDMTHRIGNVSASFLTTVFLQLADEGLLSPTDTLDRYFPDLPAADRITLADLARSTTGYAHHPATPDFIAAFYADPFRPWAPADLVALGTAGGTAFEPGTGWSFSDTNLVVLGLVLESVTGTSVHRLIEERILGVADLPRTTTPTTAALDPPVLHGYTDERGVFEDATYWTPTWVPFAGDMASDVADVARWLRILAGGELLSEESRALLFAPATAGLGPNTDERYYAMGIGVSRDWIFTTPSLHGYMGTAAHALGDDLTIVVFATRTPEADPDARPDSRLVQALGELLLPENPPAFVRR